MVVVGVVGTSAGERAGHGVAEVGVAAVLRACPELEGRSLADGGETTEAYEAAW